MGLAIALAGGAGAFSRYALDYLAGDHLDPHHQVYVTLAVNVVGSLLLGLLIGVHPDGRTRIVLGVGFLAAFTTFSTLVAQMYHAAGAGRYARSVALPLITIVAGLLTLSLGVAAGRALAGSNPVGVRASSDSAFANIRHGVRGHTGPAVLRRRHHGAADGPHRGLHGSRRSDA
jgi:CrcB protein